MRCKRKELWRKGLYQLIQGRSAADVLQPSRPEQNQSTPGPYLWLSETRQVSEAVFRQIAYSGISRPMR